MPDSGTGEKGARIVNAAANPATAKSPQGEVVPQRIEFLRALLGEFVFFPCGQGDGGKGPLVIAWQKLTLAQMTPEHVRQCERPEYRMGVGLGRQSFGLCGLDCDDDGFLAEILRLNPALARTLTTACNRGATLWLRFTDPWPANKPLFWHGNKVGEWRATGNLSVVAGQDTDTGNWRRFVVRAPALVLPFASLDWPPGLTDASGTPWPGSPADFEPLFGIGDVERSSAATLRSTSLMGRAAQEKAAKQERLYQDLLGHLPTKQGERNAFICRTVPYLFHAVCEALVIRFSMRYFDEVGKPSGWRGDRDGHRKSVGSLIEALKEKYPVKLSPAERGIYERLKDDTERAAFRICRDCARRAGPRGIFPMAYGELAARLNCATGKAEKLLKGRFRDELQILRVDTVGQRRAKGRKGIGTRWRYRSFQVFRLAHDEP